MPSDDVPPPALPPEVKIPLDWPKVVRDVHRAHLNQRHFWDIGPDGEPPCFHKDDFNNQIRRHRHATERQLNVMEKRVNRRLDALDPQHTNPNYKRVHWRHDWVRPVISPDTQPSPSVALNVGATVKADLDRLHLLIAKRRPQYPAGFWENWWREFHRTLYSAYRAWRFGTLSPSDLLAATILAHLVLRVAIEAMPPTDIPLSVASRYVAEPTYEVWFLEVNHSVFEDVVSDKTLDIVANSIVFDAILEKYSQIARVSATIATDPEPRRPPTRRRGSGRDKNKAGHRKDSM
jgi:hypothetical protein